MTLASELDASRLPESLPRQSIQISRREWENGGLCAANRALAVLILSCRGYVILKDAVTHEFVEQLRGEFAPIYQDCRETLGVLETGADVDSALRWHVSSRAGATFWFRMSRWRIFPRLTGRMSDPALLANPFVVPILEDLLGPDFLLQYVSSDTCVQGSILQSPHSDIERHGIFADNRWRARGFIVNIPLMECGLHNGPLEVWPGGSHLWAADLLGPYGLRLDLQDGRNPLVEQVADYFPSIKLALQPGDILIRDLAMLHRGTPNPTDQPRTMFTLGYFRRDYTYGYGNFSYNLDEALFRDLHPRIQKMYAPHFSFVSRLRRRQRRIRSAAKRGVVALLRARGRNPV
jgi:ectoine hydroxylase-related dioxygenase (phytanoyl-CoA dioxygenase family)